MNLLLLEIQFLQANCIKGQSGQRFDVMPHAPFTRTQGVMQLLLAKWFQNSQNLFSFTSRVLLLFMNIFIHIQLVSLHSRNMFVYI